MASKVVMLLIERTIAMVAALAVMVEPVVVVMETKW